MLETTMTVSAAEASRRFPALRRAARSGTRVIITFHGKPVAEMGPAKGAELSEKMHRDPLAAFKEMQAQWAKQEPVFVGPWAREELYERGPIPEA